MPQMQRRQTIHLLLIRVKPCYAMLYTRSTLLSAIFQKQFCLTISF